MTAPTNPPPLDNLTLAVYQSGSHSARIAQRQTLGQIVDIWIRGQALADILTNYRRLLAQHGPKHNLVRGYKTANFPGITVCGVIADGYRTARGQPDVWVVGDDYRKGGWPISHSGLYQIDIDKVRDASHADELIRLASELDCVVLAFRSPSGGVKIIVRGQPPDCPAPKGPAEQRHTAAHRLEWQQADDYIARHLGVQPDPVTKALTGLMFLSHDPEAYYNPHAVPLGPAPKPPPRPAAPQGAPSAAQSRQDDRLAAELWQYLQQALPASGSETYNDWVGVAGGIWAKLGEEACQEWIAGSNRPHEKVNSPGSLTFSMGGLVEIAKRYGWRRLAHTARIGEDAPQTGYEAPPRPERDNSPPTPGKAVKTPRAVWEELDSQWLLESGLLIVRISLEGDLMVQYPDGRWQPVSSTRRTMARSYINRQLQELAPHRQNINPADPPPSSSRYCDHLVKRIFEDMARLPQFQHNEFNRPLADGSPVLPVQSGGGWDIARQQTVDPAQMRAMHIVTQWQIPDPTLDREPDPTDPGLLLLRNLVEGVLHPVSEALAFGMAHTPKGTVIIKSPSRNTGKSTLVQKAVRVMTGAMRHVPSTWSLSTQGGFSGQLAYLGLVKVLIFDEMDARKTAPIRMPDFEAAHGDDLEVHLKYENPCLSTRCACAVWLCNDWPALPWGTAGLVGEDDNLGRADFAPIRMGDHETRLSVADRKLIMQSEEAGIWLRQHLLERAAHYARQDADFYAAATERVREAIDAGRAEVRELRDNAADPDDVDDSLVDAVISRLLYTGSRNDRLTIRELRQALGSPDRELPAGFGRKLRAQWPSIPEDAFRRSLAFKVDGKTERGMQGWQLLPDTEGRQPDADTDRQTAGTFRCTECGTAAPVGTGDGARCNFCAN